MHSRLPRRRRRVNLWLVAQMGMLTGLPSVAAQAGTVLYTVSIGFNGVAGDGSADPGPAPLRFADDDASAFHQLARTLSRRSYLLTTPDVDTRAQFPELIGEARPPSLGELTRVLEDLGHELAQAARGTEETSVIIFYSGHGTVGHDGQGSLALLDGVLTRDYLYERVLAPLEAQHVHLLIDACHAELVVRPRDGQAEVVSVTESTAAAYLAQATLARFPNVGAIVASTSDAQAHEWDGYGSGVFTHEVLSGLRGGADVNGDHQIEYSELAAFLAAANRSVSDPRGRLSTVVRAPTHNPRAPLIDLRGANRLARLRGHPETLGAFYVEDAHGNRVLDLRAERGFSVELLVPAGTLFLRSAHQEAELRLLPGQTVAFGKLTMRPMSARPRGSIDSSLRAGLFATRFGPGYYSGFVDRHTDLVSVDLAAQAVEPIPDPLVAPRRRWSPWVLGGAGVLAGAAAVFTGVALEARSDFRRTDIADQALAARDRYDRARFTAVGMVGAALLAAGVGLWLSATDR